MLKYSYTLFYITFLFVFTFHIPLIHAFEVNDIYFEDSGLVEIPLSDENINDSENNEISHEVEGEEIDVEQEVSVNYKTYEIFLDESTVKKGYTYEVDENMFRLGFNSGVLAEETGIRIKHFSSDVFTFPDGFKPVSDVYEFDILNAQSFDNTKPFILEARTFSNVLGKKRVYFYNGVVNSWVELPSWAADENKVRSYIHLPYAKLVVLEDNNVMEVGHASWYAYKNCDCAASPDYPKGTLLDVTNLDTGKTITVRVNDWGPERDIFPNRVIDLDKVAFQKLGKLSDGVLKNILVTPAQ